MRTLLAEDQAVEEQPQEQMGTAERRESAENRAQGVIHSFLLEHVAEFRDLQAQRKKGWENEEATAHFQTQRRNADHADEARQLGFWRMMHNIANEMDVATAAFQFRGIAHAVRVLDLCMAPGGYTDTVLDRYPNATAKALTLPEDQAGHKVRLSQAQRARCEILYGDITMLAADMGLSAADNPVGHPDAGAFKVEKALKDDERFDIVFCDGQVQREQPRAEWRTHREARRLTLVQLAMGLEHVREGGTMVVLLHKVEAYQNLRMLRDFGRFAEVKVFKPTKSHKMKSSFYLVAKCIRKGVSVVDELVAEWKKDWRIATFGVDKNRKGVQRASEDDARRLVEEFGEKAMELGRPVWQIQAEALKSTTCNKPRGGGPAAGFST